MTEPLDALTIAYGDATGICRTLDEPMSWRPTGCAGWAVRDLVFHLLGDAQRALVALGTPAAPPADRNSVTYWTDFSGTEDTYSVGLRAVRTMASAWRLDNLTAAYQETANAVISLAGRTQSTTLIKTQGHVLTVNDLIQTLIVEATIHHLDLVQYLDQPGPQAAPLAMTRQVVDDLLGVHTPSEWDDASWVAVATGRRRFAAEHIAQLGSAVDRLPVIR